MKKLIRFIACVLAALTVGFPYARPALADGLPDLQPTQIVVTTLYAGIANAVTAVIVNNGNTAVSNFTARLDVNGTAVASVTESAIAALNDPYYWPLSIKFNWTPDAAGNYTLRVIIDPDSAVTESDETNNQMEQPVSVIPLAPVTIKVRMEGKTTSIWSGNVTFSNSTITDKQGTTHTVNHPTALGALHQAAQAGEFGYVISSAYGNLSFVEGVAGESNQGLNGWLYRVNAASPPVAAIDYTLSAGDEVLWYFGGWMAEPLRLSLDNNSLQPSENFTATIETYNGTAWTALSGATLHAGSHLYTTDVNGQIKNITLPPGGYTAYADKDDYSVYIRSNTVTVTVYVPLNLKPGWNFISVPGRLAPDHRTAEKVFAGVDTAGHSIFLYDASLGWVTAQNTTEIRPLDAVWVFSATAAELHPVFDSDPRQVPVTKQLAAGWNTIGFTDFTPASANSALTSVESKWATLLGFDATSQDYEAAIINNAPDADPHAESRPMSTWCGYWLYMTAAGEAGAIS